jgi:hypothetical protein
MILSDTWSRVLVAAPRTSRAPELIVMDGETVDFERISREPSTKLLPSTVMRVLPVSSAYEFVGVIELSTIVMFSDVKFIVSNSAVLLVEMLEKVDVVPTVKVAATIEVFVIETAPETVIVAQSTL